MKGGTRATRRTLNNKFNVTNTTYTNNNPSKVHPKTGTRRTKAPGLTAGGFLVPHRPPGMVELHGRAVLAVRLPAERDP